MQRTSEAAGGMGEPGVSAVRPPLWRIADIMLIPALLLVAAALAISPAASSPRTVLVYRDNTVIAEYPLSADGEYTVQGYEGPMVVEIRNGHVSVIHSTCRRHICVRTQAVSHPGRQIVCAPNHVVIRVSADTREEGDVDAVAQ